MTHLRQHIEELDVDRWAPITKRAATAAVDAAAAARQSLACRGSRGGRDE
ncbi:hypothetical protein [Mycobacterium kiyosense]|nr:hypothetical protein [Mycobacterium kiyosense]